MQKVLGVMRAAVERYGMIEENDRVAVGVSGGKDSLVLLAGMAGLRRALPKKFELVAVTADPCFSGVETDYSAIEALCEEWQIPYRIRRTELGDIIFNQRQEKNPCSLCARMRRGILHDMALEAGCNKVALGHHFDDAVETVIMNLFYGGRFGCFSPKSYLSNKGLWLIRPMVFCEERTVANVANRLELPVVKSKCPADGNTSREQTKQFLRQMEEQIPDIRKKILGALERAGVDGWHTPFL